MNNNRMETIMSHHFHIHRCSLHINHHQSIRPDLTDLNFQIIVRRHTIILNHNENLRLSKVCFCRKPKLKHSSYFILDFPTKIDPYPSSSTSPFDPALFYNSTTSTNIPCSSSTSPISPNTAAAAAYYSNTYYSTPASYYFPYGTTTSSSTHHQFINSLTCPTNHGATPSTGVGGVPPLSPSFLQAPGMSLTSNMSTHSSSSSPKEHENLFNSSTATSDVGQY